MHPSSRREFLSRCAGLSPATALAPALSLSQTPGERPQPFSAVRVLNPRNRVPVGLIIDDSTCLVNLNRFAMPQFDQAHGGTNKAYHKNWRDWPVEIPDAFVRKFGEWCAGQGVKGKYSIVPYPACVGRVDRLLPGWTHRELQQSLELVRTVMAPNWDIHPEMVTHTRVIDVRTGHPYPEVSPRFMENWDWTTGKPVEAMTEYLAYALRILKDAGLYCEGVTTPGGFGNRARPQLAQGTLLALKDVYGTEIPHYFRDLYDEGTRSVAPLVQNASGLDSPDPRCVVSIIGCTGDWTGGWDCSDPEGPDRFILPGLDAGRMVEVIQRGEPAIMVCHWTGIYWNGQELGFKVFQEVVRRLHARFKDQILWMKLCELSHYWAARELTAIQSANGGLAFKAPFACPAFTLECAAGPGAPRVKVAGQDRILREVERPQHLENDTWCRQGERALICFTLPKGGSRIQWMA